MKLKFRKFILYPIMDLIFNYKTKPSNLQPMGVRLASHPAPSKKGKDLDLRTMPFEDWMIYIIRENKHKLPWNKK